MLGAREVYGKFIAAFEERGNGVVDCALTMPLVVPPGAVLVIKLNPGTGAAFNFGQSSGIDMENVRVTRAPQMAFAVQRSENFRAKGVRVSPNDDSLLATGADGLHLIQCRGAVTVEDCHFSNLGDDCVNVHDFYLAVDRWLRADAVQLMERSVFKIQNIATARYLPQVGDVVQILDRGTLAVVGQTRVSSVDMSAPAPVIGFETSIEAAQNGAPTLMCGTGSAPRVSIAKSTFARSRARGLLLHSNASIEDCHFQGFSLAGVAVEADAAMWGEGCGIGGVTISNSTFSQCSCRTRRRHRPHRGCKPGGVPVQRTEMAISSSTATSRSMSKPGAARKLGRIVGIDCE